MTVGSDGRGATTGRAGNGSTGSVRKWDERRRDQNGQRRPRQAQRYKGFIILPAATEQWKWRETNFRKGGRGLLFASPKSPTRLVTAVASGWVIINTCVQYILRITYLLDTYYACSIFYFYFVQKAGPGLVRWWGSSWPCGRGCKGQLSRGEIGFKREVNLVSYRIGFFAG